MQLTVSKFYSMLRAKRAPLSKLQIVICILVSRLITQWSEAKVPS